MKFIRLKENCFWKLSFVLIFSALLLFSCAAPENKNSVSSNQTSENKNAEAIKPKNENPESNLLNACLVLPKTEVEKILGQPVSSANLSRAVEATEKTAALSECTYQTANNQKIEFFARRSPVGDNTPEAVQQVRETMKKVTRKEVENVNDVGAAAFWVPAVNQLHVFVGDNVYLYFTMRDFKNESEAKAKAVELARQAINSLSAR